MKKQPRGPVFLDDEATKVAVMEVLEGSPPDYFRQGLEALAKHSQKCFSVHGDYVKKSFFAIVKKINF